MTKKLWIGIGAVVAVLAAGGIAWGASTGGDGAWDMCVATAAEEWGLDEGASVEDFCTDQRDSDPGKFAEFYG